MRALVVLAVLLLAMPASAQVARPPAAPRAPVAPAAPAVRAVPLSSAGLQSSMRPQTSLRGFSTGNFSGLGVVGDTAPICRAQCSRERASCAGDDDQCVDRWRQCVEACLRPPYR